MTSMDTPNTRDPTKSDQKCFAHHRKYIMLSDRELDFSKMLRIFTL